MYLLLLIIPVILFYILKLRINTAVSATAFIWQQVLKEQRAVQRWHIRRIISLLLSILFIILLVAAVWNPKVNLPAGKPKNGIQLAITRFIPRRSLDEPVNYEVLVEVENKGTQTAETMLGVQLNERLLETMPFTVPAKSVQQTVMRDTSPSGGVLQCALIDKVKQTQFSTATVILPPVEIQTIFLYGEDNVFLKNGLESLPYCEIIHINKPQDTIPQNVPQNAVLVLNRYVPKFLPAGNILIFSPQQDSQFFTVGGMSGISLVEETDESSPLVKQLGLQNTLLQGAKKITFQEYGNFSSRVLAAAADRNPLYFQIETPERNVLVFNADLNKSGITSQTTFPLLLSNALRYFRGETDEPGKTISLSHRDSGGSYSPLINAKPSKGRELFVWFPLTAVCLFWTITEWFLFQRRKLE